MTKKNGKPRPRLGFLTTLTQMADALEEGDWEELFTPSDLAKALREAVLDLEIYISINQRQQSALLQQQSILKAVRNTPKIANLIARHHPGALKELRTLTERKR